MAEYDYDTDIAVQRKEAFEDGISLGEKKAKLETAKVLKSAGIEINLIINSTGLSPEEIEKL